MSIPEKIHQENPHWDKSTSKQEESELLPDIFLFFDCILNDSLQHLEVRRCHSTSVTEEGRLYFVQLMKTIAHRCPSLQSLYFDFSHSTHSWNPDAHCARSLSGFTNLTNLELEWCSQNNFNCTDFFIFLGSSCPKLEKLKLHNRNPNQLSFGLDQQLAFILGEAFHLFPYDVMQDLRKGTLELHRLQFNRENVTPICASLQSLQVWSSGDGFDRSHQVSSIAFLLRHIPGLKKLAVEYLSQFFKFNVSEAVRYLGFCLDSFDYGEEEYGDIVEMTPIFRRLRWTTNLPPSRKNYQPISQF